MKQLFIFIISLLYFEHSNAQTTSTFDIKGFGKITVPSYFDTANEAMFEIQIKEWYGDIAYTNAFYLWNSETFYESALARAEFNRTGDSSKLPKEDYGYDFLPVASFKKAPTQLKVENITYLMSNKRDSISMLNDKGQKNSKDFLSIAKEYYGKGLKIIKERYQYQVLNKRPVFTYIADIQFPANRKIYTYTICSNEVFIDFKSYLFTFKYKTSNSQQMIRQINGIIKTATLY